MEEKRKLNAVREAAGKYAPHQLELLREFAGIDCGTGDLDGNRRVVDIVQRELSHLPAEIVLEEGENGIHVVARIKPESPKGKIIINSHLDTVFHPGDTAAHPFRIEGEYAYGLGVSDCKGGFVTSAVAVRIAAEEGLLPDWEIVLIYNCDEETGSFTSREIFEREAKDADYAFVFEPGRNLNGILTRRKGCAVITVDVTGKEAHAGLNYTGGADATLEMARQLVTLSSKNVPEKGIYFNAGLLTSGKHADVVSDSAHMEIFTAIPSEADLKWIQEALEEMEKNVTIPGCIVKTELTLLFPPMECTEKTRKLYNRVVEAGKIVGLELPEEESAGSSDACWFASYGVPTVDALGPYMNDIHTVRERVKIKTIQERTELFAMVLARL